jgi:hypothetical protein
MPIPKINAAKSEVGREESLFQKIKSVKFTPTSIVFIFIWFTCTSIFQN